MASPPRGGRSVSPGAASPSPFTIPSGGPSTGSSPGPVPGAVRVLILNRINASVPDRHLQYWTRDYARRHGGTAAARMRGSGARGFNASVVLGMTRLVQALCADEGIGGCVTSVETLALTVRCNVQ